MTELIKNGTTVVLSSNEAAEVLAKHVASKLGRFGNLGTCVDSLPNEIRVTIGDPAPTAPPSQEPQNDR